MPFLEQMIAYLRVAFLAGKNFSWAFLQYGLGIISPVTSTIAGQFSRVTAANARFMQPLFTRAPWLAKFLRPLAWVNPIFAVLEIMAAIAAVPYVIAGAVGAAMFAYAFTLEFIVNTFDGLRTYASETVEELGKFFRGIPSTFRSIWHNYDNEPWYIRTRDFFKTIFSIPLVPVFIVVVPLLLFPFDLLRQVTSEAFARAKDATMMTLDSGPIRLMLKPWEKLFGEQDKSRLDKLEESAKLSRSRLINVTQRLGSRGYRTNWRGDYLDEEFPVLSAMHARITELENKQAGANLAANAAQSTTPPTSIPQSTTGKRTANPAATTLPTTLLADADSRFKAIDAKLAVHDEQISRMPTEQNVTDARLKLIEADVLHTKVTVEKHGVALTDHATRIGDITTVQVKQGKVVDTNAEILDNVRKGTIALHAAITSETRESSELALSSPDAPKDTETKTRRSFLPLRSGRKKDTAKSETPSGTTPPSAAAVGKTPAQVNAWPDLSRPVAKMGA